MKYVIRSKSGQLYYLEIHHERMSLVDSSGGYIDEVSMNSLETHVISVICQQGNVAKPVSARSIEDECFKKFNRTLSLNTLKNTIASLRKKYRDLTARINISESDSLFIKNVNRIGFYICLTCSQPVRENVEITSEVDKAIPSFFRLPVLMIKHFRKELVINLVKYFAISIAFFILVYGIQILYVAKNATYYKNNFTSISERLASNYLSCSEEEKLSAIFHDSLNMDSAIISKNGVAECEVHEHTTEALRSAERVEKWLNRTNRFFYVNKSYGDIEITARFSRNTLAARYDRYTFLNLLTAVELKAGQETLMATGDTSTMAIFSYKVGSDFTVLFYSNTFVLYVVALTALLAIGANYRCLSSSYSYWLKYKNFTVKLEPVVDTRSQQAVFLEALSRFENCDVQLAISCLKKSGLLGLHTILIVNALGAVKGNHRFSVNLCPSLLSGAEFKRFLSQLRGTDARYIVFELTENSLVSYDATVIENIKQLQKLGFSIAIDDFGVGNNNMSLLKMIHPDFIKIDRMFTSELDKDIKQQELLTKFIAIAQLEATAVIFEGIERQSQSLALTKLGGYFHQGYLYSMAEIPTMVKQEMVSDTA